MIPERGVAYYGVAYPDRAEGDFLEMAEHGCNAVLLAVSEFDWWFWRRNTVRLIEKAHDVGLKVYVDLWGWGKTLAGEPPSIYLMREREHRQVSASGRVYDAVCLNHEGFREHLRTAIREMAEQTDLDAFFWDEPHYANWRQPDWACRCSLCRGLYKAERGEEMPRELTQAVVEFRERRAVDFLKALSEAAKEADAGVGVAVCLLPDEDPLIGITDWSLVASIDEVDILGTDPYWFHAGLSREEGLEYFRSRGLRLLQLARKSRKRSQLWLQAFRVPKGRERELLEGAVVADELGVDSLFAWPYRGGAGSILESGDAQEVWRVLGEAYRMVSN